MAPPVKISFARFDAGRLVFELKNLNDVKGKYYAISHVWGDASWQKIHGLKSEVLVSEHKAALITESLAPIVDAHYFWMDVLCVNQRSESARLQVVRHIPLIFRNAAKTIVIREGSGIRKCCLEAMGNVDDWHDPMSGAKVRWLPHMRKHHADGLREEVLQRLWPLQEIILSDNLQFITCKEPSPEEDKLMQDKLPFSPYAAQDDFRAVSDSMQSCAQAWSRVFVDDSKVNDDEIRFVSAFLTNGSVSRNPRSHNNSLFENGEPGVMGFRDELWSQINSTRTTSKARDFILAIMPQYGWYKIPLNVRSMTFGELFVNCFEQGRKAKKGFAPLITSGIIDGAQTDLPYTARIPEPTCLGDFVKLLRGQVPHTVLFLRQIAYAGVRIIPGALQPLPVTFEAAYTVIKKAMEQSRLPWHLAHVGELNECGTWPECYEGPSLHSSEIAARVREESRLFQLGTPEARRDAEDSRLRRILHTMDDRQAHRRNNDPAFCAKNSRAVLNVLWAGASGSGKGMVYEATHVRRWLRDYAPAHLYIGCLLRLTALISCGLGISSYDWSLRYLTPMIFDLNGSSELVLVSKAFIERRSSREIFCVIKELEESGKEDRILMAKLPGRQTLTTVGLFHTLG